MSVTAALSRQYKSLDLSHGRGLVPEVVDKGVGMGASYALGQLVGRDPNGGIAGMPWTLSVGIAGTGLAILGEVMGVGHLSHHLNTIANAGLYNYAFAHGVSAGSKSGSIAPRKSAVLGEIPAAPPGTGLTPDEIRHFATRVR